ncbi:hypothetical protein [Alkalihalobacterium bogoriense]|uniref:hypothetical protein n=1 Tax=Alkalihalobacterium bogoriense TaxID=246272 RepID=UPI00047D073D|nr:hypothetical protein [Alkalihalobacterium bogoriense]
MRKYAKFNFVMIAAILLLWGCSSNEEVSNNDSSENNASIEKEDTSVSETSTVIEEVYSFEEEEGVKYDAISINYDGSVVFFNKVDKSGEKEMTTPYFVYNGEVIDASTIGVYTDCRFYGIKATSTHYFEGRCKDETETNVSVVFNIEANEISHSANSDYTLYALPTGKVLYIESYSDEGTIYELTDKGSSPFITINDMPTILGFNFDQSGEIFFIYGANDDEWKAYTYDASKDSDPVLFKAVPDDDEATTVEGQISPDGQYIMYRLRGVSGGKHYNYVDSYIFNLQSEEEIHIGHGFGMNFVRPNGFVFDSVREYGQVIYDMGANRWFGYRGSDIKFFESVYKNEYLNETERDLFSSSEFLALSGDGETVLTLDWFYGTDESGNSVNEEKIQKISISDYIHFIESLDVEIDFIPSEFNEIGA